jgi:hypothetical protein
MHLLDVDLGELVTSEVGVDRTQINRLSDQEKQLNLMLDHEFLGFLMTSIATHEEILKRMGELGPYLSCESLTYHVIYSYIEIIAKVRTVHTVRSTARLSLQPPEAPFAGMLLALATSHPTKSSAAMRRVIVKAVSREKIPWGTG